MTPLGWNLGFIKNLLGFSATEHEGHYPEQFQGKLQPTQNP